MKIFFDAGKKYIMIRRMEPIWNEMGYFLSDSPKGCEIQLSVIRIERSSGLPVVLRLDGVYYDLDTDYESRNASIREAHMKADGIVYQSFYGEGICKYYLGRRKQEAIHKVIFNGIEKDWVKRKEHQGMNIVVVSIWRRHKRLKEIVELFLRFASMHKDVYLHVVGELCGNSKVGDSRIFYYSQMEYYEMKKLYEKADLYIHLSKRDNCPNTVVEAIGAGVPVLTTNLCGGATELCKIYDQGHICYEGRNSFHPVYNYQEEWNILPEETRGHLLSAMNSIYYIGSKIGRVPEELDIRNVAHKYIEIMEDVCERR